MAPRLAEALGCAEADLPARLGNHMLRVGLSCPSVPGPDGESTLDWWGCGWRTGVEDSWQTLTPMAGTADPSRFSWPDPSAPGLLDEATAALASDPLGRFVVANMDCCLFERLCALRGYDTALMDLLDDQGFIGEVLDRITDIQLLLAKRFVSAGVDGGFFADDYGAQRGLLFSPRVWRKLIKPRLARLFHAFRGAGLPVIMHCDGDIAAILPDLVEIGLTCLNPVQPEVIQHWRLFQEFGDRISFFGGISTQTTLRLGTPITVRSAAAACRADLAPDGTGLILGPSHCLRSHLPMPNVLALVESLRFSLARGAESG